MKTILGIGFSLLDEPGFRVRAFEVLRPEALDFFALLFQDVVPARDPFPEELHLLPEGLHLGQHGLELLLDARPGERLEIDLDRLEIPDLVGHGLDLLERVAEELEVADELAEEDVLLGVEAEAALGPHVRLDDALVLPVLDRPRADPRALGQAADREVGMTFAGRFPALAVFWFWQADLPDDLLDLVEPVAQGLELLDMLDPGKRLGREEWGLVVGEPGRPEEFSLEPGGERLVGDAGFLEQVSAGEDIFVHVAPIRIL